MTPEQLQAEMQRHHAAVMAIRDRVQAANRDLTPDEVQQIDQHLSAFNLAAHELEHGDDGNPYGRSWPEIRAAYLRRRSEPDIPGGGPVGRQRDDERLVDAGGNEIRVLAKTDRVLDTIPRREHLAPTDLGAIIYGAATGDFSRVSDACRQVMASQYGGADAAGGVLIPTPLSAEVIDIMRQASVFMQSGARTVLMGSRTLDFGRVTQAPTPAWRGESQVIAETSAILDRVTLNARNLGVLVRSSLELLEDSPTASRVLRDLIASEMAAELDRAMLMGNGALEPEGLATMATSSPSTGVQIIPTVGTPTDYSVWVQALGLLWAVNTTPTAVMVSANTRAVLAALDSGNPVTAIRPPADLAALPWLTTAKLGGTGSPQESVSVVADFSTCVVGMRQELRIQVSDTGGTYTDAELGYGDTGDAFARNQLRIRGTLRADLVAFQPSKIVVLQGITD